MAIEIMDGNEELNTAEEVVQEAENNQPEAQTEEKEKKAPKAEQPRKSEHDNRKKDRRKRNRDKDKAKEPVKEKEKEKDKRDEQIADLTEHLKRNLAEFDNFRKRTEAEKEAMFDMGAKNVIEKLLPVVDNFERGFASLSDEDKADNSFVNGMDMVYKQVVKLLEDLGVEEIKAKGKEFDPNLHNAVMHVDDENLGENIIVQEFQKGYTYKGKVIRYSMVQVAN